MSEVKKISSSKEPLSLPIIPADVTLPEITLKVVILAILLTLILAASNAYLALKVGMTISASIPASVLSMAVLRLFKNSNILENNIVQTAASAGEGVAAVTAFISPALLILGYWHYFHYWDSVLLIICGGFLGVLFSIPLRKILLNHPNLSFPEGTAVGHVLAVSSSKNNLKPLAAGGLVGGIIAFMQTGLKLVSNSMGFWFQSSNIIYGMSLGFAPALFAAGYIVGISAAVPMLSGILTGWGLGIPAFSYFYGIPQGQTPYDMAMNLWSDHLRYVGVGTLLLGGIWTLFTMVKPILLHIVSATKESFNKKTLADKVTPRTEADIPMKYVIFGAMLVTVSSFVLLYTFSATSGFSLSNSMFIGMSLTGTLIILLGGFFIAALAAYMSGLVGISNTPLSGIMLCAVIISSLIFLSFMKFHWLPNTKETADMAMLFVLYIALIVAAVASICGENIQDLKAGQIVGATPWKQQAIIMFGVVVAALIVNPVLQLLFEAYGIGGIPSKPGMDLSQMLPAPQASLIAAVVQGVLMKGLDWLDIGIGMLLAAFCIFLDYQLRKFHYRFGVLAFGLGIYLPPDVITPLAIAGFVRYFADKVRQKNIPEQASHTQQSILVACGMVAGAALMGVALAIPLVLEGTSDALRIVPSSFTPIAHILGVIASIGICIWLFKAAQKAV